MKLRDRLDNIRRTALSLWVAKLNLILLSELRHYYQQRVAALSKTQAQAKTPKNGVFDPQATNIARFLYVLCTCTTYISY
jgi:hypothetical protein